MVVGDEEDGHEAVVAVGPETPAKSQGVAVALRALDDEELVAGQVRRIGSAEQMAADVVAAGNQEPA